MPRRPRREQPWQDERLGAQNRVSWDELLGPDRDSGDVYNDLAARIGLRDARPGRTAREPLPDVSDLRDEMGL